MQPTRPSVLLAQQAHRYCASPERPPWQAAPITRYTGTCAAATGTCNGQAQEEGYPGLQRGKVGRITFPRLFSVLSIPYWALYI